MNFIEQTIHNETILEQQIHSAIIRSVQSASVAARSLGKKPEEPDLVAKLVTEFTPELYTIMQTVYSGIRFNITSVFTHQRPLVNIGTVKSPELGDILFVHIHTDKNGRKWRNSLLLQAKISKSLKIKVSTTDRRQLKLYQDWPDFKYKRAGSLTGQHRKVQPKLSHDGAQYLMIDNSPSGISGFAGTFPMGCAIADKDLVLDKKLSEELTEFLKFKAGRQFEEKDSTNDDWSKIIWDLISMSQSAVFNRRNSGILMSSRVSTHSELFPDPPVFSKTAVDQNDEVPSVLIIAIESREGLETNA